MLSNTQQNANGGGVPVRTISYQIACTHTAANGASMAYFASAPRGQHDAGLLLYNNEADGGYFREFINLVTNAGKVFGIDRRGTVSFGRYRTDGTTVSDVMHMQIKADSSLGWVNAPKNVQLMNINQNGDLSLYGGLAAANINTAGNISANGTIQGGSVQASGNIVAGGGMQANYIDLRPAGTPTAIRAVPSAVFLRARAGICATSMRPVVRAPSRSSTKGDPACVSTSRRRFIPSTA